MVVGAIAGGVTAALERDSWGDIGISALAGAGTGALAGLTFGASLLAEGTAGSIALNIGAKSAIFGAVEAGREYFTGSGCLNTGQILTAAAFGALGDGAGAAAERYAAPLGRNAADAWSGIFGSSVDRVSEVVIGAGQANARAASYHP